MRAGISAATHRKLNNGDADVPSITANVSLRRVNFRYPSHSSQLALKDVSLNAPAGAFIALVGATGSGKSSVINLLERFYTGETGAIALDDMPIEQYNLDSYRGYLALVDQNPCLIGETLSDCLQSGELVVLDDEILAALEDVGLADYVVRAFNPSNILVTYPDYLDNLSAITPSRLKHSSHGQRIDPVRGPAPAHGHREGASMSAKDSVRGPFIENP